MKIRPKPNFGGGGAASRSSAAKPASQGSAACQEPQVYMHLVVVCTMQDHG